MGRQAEHAAPASPHQPTASLIAPVLKPLPPLSASRASDHKVRLPEELQCSYDTQVRLWEYCGGPLAMHAVRTSTGIQRWQRTQSVLCTSLEVC